MNILPRTPELLTPIGVRPTVCKMAEPDQDRNHQPARQRSTYPKQKVVSTSGATSFLPFKDFTNLSPALKMGAGQFNLLMSPQSLRVDIWAGRYTAHHGTPPFHRYITTPNAHPWNCTAKSSRHLGCPTGSVRSRTDLEVIAPGQCKAGFESLISGQKEG